MEPYTALGPTNINFIILLQAKFDKIFLTNFSKKLDKIEKTF